VAEVLRLLFCTYEGGGHVGPMLLVAQAAQARGHAVRVVSDACNAPDAAALGLLFEPWRTAPNRADKTRPATLCAIGKPTTPPR
jgi:UDP:flavonoid glycosyltransferase YjiC (YdhE family)